MRASSSRRDERSSSIASRPPLVRRLYPSYLSARRLPGKLPLHYSHSTGQTRSSKNCQGKRAVLEVFWSARYCGGENAGKHGIDTGRALYGQTVWGDTIGGLGVWGQMSGAFFSTGNKIARPVRSYPVTTEDYDSFLRFDAAALWGDHAGNEFTPEHYRQSVALYLGSPAEV